MIQNYHLQIFDISSDDIDNKFVITIYGKTNDNLNIICHINDFKPYYYIKIPENWSSSTIKNSFIPELKKKYDVKNYELDNNNISNPQYYKDFYGYNIKDNEVQKFKFVKLTFNNYRNYISVKKKIIK